MISNGVIENIMKIVKCLEESRLLIKGVSEAIKNEPKEHKGGSLSMLLSTFGATLLGSLLTCKGTIWVGEKTVRAEKYFQCCLTFWLIVKHEKMLSERNQI